jgi:murein DD-endopeptidase MepM/ murein hydrolase activator NlpD
VVPVEHSPSFSGGLTGQCRGGTPWIVFGLVVVMVSCHSATAPGEVCTGYSPWQISEYVLPYPVGKTYRVLQGNCSGYGHSGVYKYSLDFDMPLGSVVTAARAGVVAEVRTGYVDGDTVGGHENFVKIQHADGVISAYSHLGTNGVLVRVGQAVSAGDTIGLSGNTGATGGVRHLHFHLTPCSEPVDCGTLPVTFRNTSANPNSLLVEHSYTALPY